MDICFDPSRKMRNSENTSSELLKLKDLDNLLKCGICYEYLKTTLITPCSHNYCSYCIRQSLSYRNQCPSCFEDINESQLRNNRVVDEFIAIFTCIKEKLHKFLNLPNVKIKYEIPKANEESSEGGNNKKVLEEDAVKLSTPNTSFNGLVGHGCSPTMPSTSKKEVLIPSMFSPKKTKSSNISEVKVACPVCNVEIPERNINIHLDACLRRTQEKRVPQGEKRKLLPKLVYHLLPDKDLRKKLNDLGLNNVGDRTTLINRHKRYTILYNSECDSLNPRPVSEIIKQLKKEEEEEKKLIPPVVKKLNVDRKADPQTNEDAQRQYIQEHKSSFQKLIEVARRNKEAKRNANTLEEADQNAITIDDNSEASDGDFKIKRPHKRKQITSDSESTDDENEVSRVVTESNLPNELLDEQKDVTHPLNVSNKENEEIVKFTTKDLIPYIEVKQPNIYTDSTDEIDTDDDFAESGSQVISKDNRKKKSSNGNHTLQPQTSSNLQPFVTSPVLITKSRLNKTPRSTTGQTNSFKKNLTPDLKSPRVCVPSSPGSAACHLPEEDVVDSDSSSNHSTSLMVYTGPEHENGYDSSSPLKTPKKNNPQPYTSPACTKTTFDLGINEILQNSEEFVGLPNRRQSTRIKESKKSVPEPKTKSKVMRKRIRIDDL